MQEETRNVYQLDNVTKLYDGRVILQIEQLAIKKGEILALVGPSGAGKSTLLRLLAFLERVSAGQLSYQGKVSDTTWPDLTARRQISMVFQRPQLLSRTVRANIEYGLRLRSQPLSSVSSIIDAVGLTSLADKMAGTLSGGEMQRVALARCLVLEPDVMLLDEPTSNLDPPNIRIMEEMVNRANREQGTTIVMVTHNIFQARRMADRVALLMDGKLVEVATSDCFFDKPTEPQTAAFIRGDIIY